MDNNKSLIEQSEDFWRSVEKEYEGRFFDIPFGNSAFQIHNFVINGQHTPERAYRAIGLAIRKKLNALREAYYSLQETQIDIDELEEKVRLERDKPWDKDKATDFQVRRWKIDLDRKRHQAKDSAKLVNDALVELKVLNEVMEKMPKYSRDKFEAGEQRHFLIRLTKAAAGIEGARESLDNMGAFSLPENLKRAFTGIGGDIPVMALIDNPDQLKLPGDDNNQKGD